MAKTKDAEKSLLKLRKQIDLIDGKMLDLIEKRMKVARKIKEIKKEVNIPIYQPAREKEIMKRLRAKVKILRSKDVEKIWEGIFAISKKIQSRR